MTDLDLEEAEWLRRRLSEAVPSHELFGLAERARTTARRRTRRRWAVAAVTAAVVAAGGVAIPRLLGDEPIAADQTVTPPVDCVAAGAVDHPDMSRGHATWIRFCPTPPGDPQVAPVLDEPVMVEAGAVMDAWRASLSDEVQPCEAGQVGLNFRVQVGFADGTIGAASGVAGCPLLTKAGQAIAGPSAFGDLLTAQGRELAGRYSGADVPADGLTCPTNPRKMDTNRDGPSSELMDQPTEQAWQHAPIMPVSAQAVAVCRYEKGRLAATTTDYGPAVESARVAESIRVALHGHVSIGAQVDCDVPDQKEYVVVLQDAAGTRRTFSVGGCGTVTLSRGVPGVDEYYGLAENQLMTVLIAAQ